MGRFLKRAAAGATVVLTAFGLAAAQPAPPSGGGAKVSSPGQYSGYSPAAYDGYVRSSFYVPMRDGTKLAVDLFRPTQNGVVASEKLPVVWMHTPYNRRSRDDGKPTVEAYPGFAIQLVKYGYNVAVVDFRGLYASFGRNRAYNRGEWLEPASTDAYDMTEWFARQPWSSGSIGMWGCSATGGSQMQAATTLPPSLKAVMPMSAELDPYPFEVLGGVAPPGAVGTAGAVADNPFANNAKDAARKANAERDAHAAPVDGPDGAALLAQAVAQHVDNIESPGVVPYRDSMSDTLHDKWWLASAGWTHMAALKKAQFGVYDVANWDEAGTKHGPFFTFNNLHHTKLLVGPETHCAWSKVQDETGFPIVTEELRFFDYWLKGIDNGVMSEPRVTYYLYNAPKESAWRQTSSWPLPNQVLTRYYFGEGDLDRAKPAAGRDSAPMSPPSRALSIYISPQTGGLSYETAPLASDVQITGDPVADLWISTAAKDTDVMARIDDVAPDGSTRSYQMLGRLRASERALAPAPYNNLGLPWHTYEKKDARPLVAGQPAKLSFDLLPMAYLFKAGHRIRVTVTFADPQRRPVSGLPPVTILRGGDHASSITLPVIPAG